MHEKTLPERVEEALAAGLRQTTGRPALAGLQHALLRCQERLQQPMRVAIVGLIKAGKSTMMNALLGEAVVATDRLEATFNVNWLQYGDPPFVRVQFKDGRAPEDKSIGELEALTRRAETHDPYLLSIKYIEVFYPRPILRTLHLIDTPGLASSYHADSENTVHFLQLHGQRLTETTQEEAQNADAVLYLFSHGLHAESQKVMEQFQGPTLGRATPINAIGVLTQVDTYWPSEGAVIEAAHCVAGRLQDEPQVRRLFYTILPVCGLLALGAQTLTSPEFNTLIELAKLPEERFTQLIMSVQRVGEREYADVPVPVARRKPVLDRLGRYGIWLAYHLIRDGVTSREQLGKALFVQSGFPELYDLITSHFGNRAYLIKLATGLRQLEKAFFQARQQASATDREILEKIASTFEEIEAQEYAFHELQVLRSHYEGKLSFAPEEVEQLLAVTGEYGTSCGERLRLGERATVVELLPVAEERARYWWRRANDYLADRQTTLAAEVLARSYELVAYRVRQAKYYLYL